MNAATLGLQPLAPAPEDVVAKLTDQERQRHGAIGMFAAVGSGSLAIQPTRPQSLAYGLTDSPAGQLAWSIEKFKEWSNPAAELPEDAIDRDTLLTNVMPYWLTATGGSAARM
ncbi:hypothetical protein [Streptomyces afghaniensis]|uniref:hypothetical protein n=1 Tax=Streptomyces afghaniensis TaxID=66865 RepID=UPI00379AF0E4